MSSLNSYEASTIPTATADNSPLSFTILWSPLPPITWVLPFIGHMGIATSRGVACDFQGPYTVGERGRMVSLLTISASIFPPIELLSVILSDKLSKAFGKPTRALRIDIRSLSGKKKTLLRCAFFELFIQPPKSIQCNMCRGSRSMGQSHNRG